MDPSPSQTPSDNPEPSKPTSDNDSKTSSQNPNPGDELELLYVDRANVEHRLAKAGLRRAADAYREEVRQRLAHAEGGPKRNRLKVNDTSWKIMWHVFQPVVEKWEKLREPPTPPPPPPPPPPPDIEPALLGLTDNVDQFLDPNYSEPDPGKWLRDGLIWTAAEIRRVVTDSPEGTAVNLDRAKTPPPTAWAVFCLESLASKPIEKRGTELMARVLPFATRSHDTPPTQNQPEHDPDPFLDSLS